MKRPLHHFELSISDLQRQSTQQSALPSSPSLSSYEEASEQCYPHDSIRNVSLRRERRCSEWNHISCAYRYNFNIIRRKRMQRIESVNSSCIRHSSFLFILLCWMSILLPVPTTGDEGTSSQLTIPQFRVVPIEYNGGIVIPALFVIDDPEINVTPAPVVAPTRIPSRNPIRTTQSPQQLPVPPPPTDTPTNTPIMTTGNPTTRAPIVIDTSAPTNAPTIMLTTNSPSLVPSGYPSHQPVSILGLLF